MNAECDLAVVGAGPGGLAAAATAAEAGMRVCLLDNNPAPGGQIWRSSVRKGTNSSVERWSRRLLARKVEVRSGWRAVLDGGADGARARTLRIESNGRYDDLTFGALVLATGAREMFLPFPGWTLPGVFGAGGLQAFVKSGLDVAGKRIGIAGTGPLLLPVAANLRAAGARIVAIVEQARMARMAQLSTQLLFSRPGKLIEGAAYALKLLGAPYHTGAWVARASGESHLKSVTITSGSHSREIETDLLAVGFHLVPNTELAQLLHCRLERGYVDVDEYQRTSVENVYGVGEITGIGGFEKALIEGRIAALTAAGRTTEARALFPARDRWMRFARRLDAAFTLRPELRALAEGETIVCRCEDVSFKDLGACQSWREAKLHTRCGMGPCQGRVCSPATQFLFGWTAPAPRPPLFPVEISALAESFARREEQDKSCFTSESPT
ncbi:MAG: FAD/NAD(P)-binding oxidoreductase [Terracidiphilus sp.]